MPADVAALSYGSNYTWPESKGANRYRRGMYTFFKRTAPHPDLTTFDCPDGITTTVARSASNTPLQALTTLNNESFVEASQAMARRVLAEPLADDAARIERIFRLCVARPMTSDERLAFQGLLAECRSWYKGHDDDARRLAGKRTVAVGRTESASWVATARIIMNLDEFLTRE
jgi:hypothetical protein